MSFISNVLRDGHTVDKAALRAYLAAREVIVPENFGAVGDGKVDDGAAIQAAFDYLNSRGGVLWFGPGKTYRSNSALALVSTDTTVERAKKVRVLEFNGATLDFSHGMFSSNYRADAQTNLFNVGTNVNAKSPRQPQALIEEGLVAIRNLRLKGPEPQPPFAEPDGRAPATGTVGLRLQLAHDVELTNIIVTNCTIGIETKDSWGIKASNVRARNCWAGFNISGGSTYATWDNCAAIQCPYGVLLRSSQKPTAPFYGAFAAISSQSFINMRIEDVWYGYILSPHDTAIRGVQIHGGYVEGIARDFIVSGFAFDQTYFNDPKSTLSSAAPNLVDRFYAQLVGKLQWGGGKRNVFYALRTPTGRFINNVHCRLTLPFLHSDVAAGFKSTLIEYVGQATGKAGRLVTYDTNGNVGPSIDLDAGILYARGVTVATKPSDVSAGGIVYVSDESGGPVLAFADGKSWRRVTDRAVVS